MNLMAVFLFSANTEEFLKIKISKRQQQVILLNEELKEPISTYIRCTIA